MRSSWSAVLLVLLLPWIAACASGAKYADVSARMPPLPEGRGRIVFYRSAVIGAAIQPSVQLNDVVVGHATPKGFFFVDRPPGDYVVACSTEAEHRLSFTLAPGQVRYVKLLMRMGLIVGRVVPELVEQERALKDLAKTRFAGAEALLVAAPAAAP